MKYFFSLIFLFQTIFLFAQQTNYPQDYFAAPMQIPLYLSGNYGEIRSNHFHGGIDIKTQGVEGIPIYAAADGYVSRIKVSPYGYGKALYITHPNGYTTVYGHLQKYAEKIETVVKKYQYQKESFGVELFPMASELIFKKGDLIAYSGNTGGSGGPHLHFEIRDSRSETPLNVLLFGFDIKDNTDPIIQSIVVYPLDDTSTVNGKHDKVRYIAKASNGSYSLLGANISAYGKIGFGIETIDRMDGVGNRLGAFEIKLFEGGKQIYGHQIDGIPFNKSRYINAHIDYEEKYRSGKRIQRSFILDNNQLPIYTTAKESGPVVFRDGETKNFQYDVIDAYNNSTSLKFTINGKKIISPDKSATLKSKDIRYYKWNRRNVLLEEDILVNIPAGVLYEDIEFQFSRADGPSTCISKLYNLHTPTVPLQSYMNVSIKLEGLSSFEKEKALIGSTANGRNFYAEGGKWEGDNISVRTRSFGGYCVMMDSIKPQITAINISEGVNMSSKWSIIIKATDNLSGIDSYRGEIDGKWVLFEYDYKKNLFYHYFDGSLEKGKHQLKFKVADGNNNRSELLLNFNI